MPLRPTRNDASHSVDLTGDVLTNVPVHLDSTTKNCYHYEADDRNTRVTLYVGKDLLSGDPPERLHARLVRLD